MSYLKKRLVDLKTYIVAARQTFVAARQICVAARQIFVEARHICVAAREICVAPRQIFVAPRQYIDRLEMSPVLKLTRIFLKWCLYLEIRRALVAQRRERSSVLVPCCVLELCRLAKRILPDTFCLEPGSANRCQATPKFIRI